MSPYARLCPDNTLAANLEKHCDVCADGPAADPQAALNTIGSVVNAAGSLASAQQALGTASTAAASGDVLQTVGSAAQALQVIHRARSISLLVPEAHLPANDPATKAKQSC